MAAEKDVEDKGLNKPPAEKIAEDGESRTETKDGVTYYYHRMIYNDGSVGDWVLTSTT